MWGWVIPDVSKEVSAFIFKDEAVRVECTMESVKF